MQNLLDKNLAQITLEHVNALNVDWTTVTERLHVMEKVLKEGEWVAHELSESAIKNRMNICISLFARQKRSFLYWIVTSDENMDLLRQS